MVSSTMYTTPKTWKSAFIGSFLDIQQFDFKAHCESDGFINGSCSENSQLRKFWKFQIWWMQLLYRILQLFQLLAHYGMSNSRTFPLSPYVVWKCYRCNLSFWIEGDYLCNWLGACELHGRKVYSLRFVYKFKSDKAPVLEISRWFGE